MTSDAQLQGTAGQHWCEHECADGCTSPARQTTLLARCSMTPAVPGCRTVQPCLTTAPIGVSATEWLVESGLAKSSCSRVGERSMFSKRRWNHGRRGMLHGAGPPLVTGGPGGEACQLRVPPRVTSLSTAITCLHCSPSPRARFPSAVCARATCLRSGTGRTGVFAAEWGVNGVFRAQSRAGFAPSPARPVLAPPFLLHTARNVSRLSLPLHTDPAHSHSCVRRGSLLCTARCGPVRTRVQRR